MAYRNCWIAKKQTPQKTKQNKTKQTNKIKHNSFITSHLKPCIQFCSTSNTALKVHLKDNEYNTCLSFHLMHFWCCSSLNNWTFDCVCHLFTYNRWESFQYLPISFGYPSLIEILENCLSIFEETFKAWQLNSSLYSDRISNVFLEVIIFRCVLATLELTLFIAPSIGWSFSLSFYFNSEDFNNHFECLKRFLIVFKLFFYAFLIFVCLILFETPDAWDVVLMKILF